MSEQFKSGPEKADSQSKQQQQQQQLSLEEKLDPNSITELNRPAQRISRHLSTPARLKPIYLQTLIEQSSFIDTNLDENSHHVSNRSPRLNKKSHLRLNNRQHHLNRHHKYRHSYNDTGSCFLNCSNQGNHIKSTSSSSASDSAFSQSQTTLESESESSNNCFRQSSLKANDSFSNDIKANLYNLNRSTTKDAGFERENRLAGIKQFNIIWKNLSYRIPDKRLARLTSYLRKKKQALLPLSSDERHQQEGEKTRTKNHDTLDSSLQSVGKPRKVIFSNLNGCVKSGELTAILGPSGAGKTTFLKCLTNNIVKGVTGSIDINDINGATTSHHLKLCIIPQKDYLFDNLTVMESLIFASRIKNTQSNFNHMQNVERVSNLLGLQACLKLKTNKLSGGQYKRVSIAQELLSNPDILILDEPTSGLDSLTCYRTVSVLRDLVNMSQAGLISPLAIVMTIHQPQMKIFNLFHHVYILSSMGKCVYEGRPEYLIDTVADCCKLLPPPDDLNPASFIIDIASEVYGLEPIAQLTKLQREQFELIHHSELTFSNDTDKLQQVELFVDSKPIHRHNSFEFSKDAAQQQQKYTQQPEEELVTSGELRISDRLKRRNNHQGNFWLHTGLLIKRLWISMWRDSLLTTTRVSFHIIIPFVFYFIYSQKSGAANACPHVEREFDFQTMASDANIQRLEVQHNELILTFENVSLFFLLLYSFSMCVLAVTALSFPLNMQILLKETSNGWYSMSRFVMAKTLADIPIELTMPTISVSIAYVLTGQPSSYLCWRMLTVTAVMTLCSLISQTQGLLFGAYFMNNVQAAVFISQASSLPWILLSGFTTRVSELPRILQWLSFGSIYRLGIESIVAVRYGFGMCPCDQELVNDSPPKMVGIPDQLRSVMRYYLDVYSDSSTASPTVGTTNNSTEDIFERIASTLSRANTYGVDIVSCHDVRPFILSAREVDEGTLPTFLLILVLMFVGLKVLLFCVVGLRAG